MIKSFKDDEAKKILEGRVSRKFGNVSRVAYRKLLMINVSQDVNDLRIPPANHLEKLKGDRRGQYSIRINDQWRICFEVKEDGYYNVEIVDYH